MEAEKILQSRWGINRMLFLLFCKLCPFDVVYSPGSVHRYSRRDKAAVEIEKGRKEKTVSVG